MDPTVEVQSWESSWESMKGLMNVPRENDETFFWELPLAELDHQQWEALCDGCGRCCLVKLEVEDTSEILYTNIGCKLLDHKTCQCGNYPDRATLVRDCITLTIELIDTISWLPPTCAYRLRAEGKPLPWWHPLLSEDKSLVHTLGISVRGKVAASEEELPEEDYMDYIVKWPLRAR